MPTPAELLHAARRARDHAHAPYSRFPVGAALLTNDGEIFVGANVENASYPISMCAERSALASAVTHGQRSFAAIAIVGPEGAAISPCGACRQALAEFGLTLRVIRENRDDVALSDLLPDAFHFERTGV